MIKVFDKTKEYEHYSQGGLISGELCYVEEDKTVHFRTNNIDGADKTYDMGEGSGSSAVLISGSFTENGSYQPEEADGYSEVTVNVPIPEGYIQPSGSKTITVNGNGIDVTSYAEVNVNVPASGITPTGSLSITENGSFDVTNYAGANVNVPIPAGYIVPSGNKAISNNGNSIDVTQFETVSVNVPASAVVSGTKSITENGTSDVTAYAAVNVNVPIPAGYIVPSGTKSISENGNNIDVTAFASVNVNVSSSGITPSGTYNITQNGTYDVTSYASASVNVSGGSQPVYTDATISDSTPLRVNLNAGETLDVYNLNHVNLMTMMSDIASSTDLYGPGGTYEHLYNTAGDIYSTPSEGQIVSVVLSSGVTGSYGIKYRVF